MLIDIARNPQRGQAERHKPMLAAEAEPSGPVGGKVLASTARQFLASAEVSADTRTNTFGNYHF